MWEVLLLTYYQNGQMHLLFNDVGIYLSKCSPKTVQFDHWEIKKTMFFEACCLHFTRTLITLFSTIRLYNTMWFGSFKIPHHLTID